MSNKACDGAATISTGCDMQECAHCGTRVAWDLVDSKFWGFQNCREKSVAALLPGADQSNNAGATQANPARLTDSETGKALGSATLVSSSGSGEGVAAQQERERAEVWLTSNINTPYGTPEQEAELDAAHHNAAYDIIKALLSALSKQDEALTAITELLRLAYGCIESKRLGRTRCTDIDPAGNTYEFTEHEWSIKARAILGITYEPTGI